VSERPLLIFANRYAGTLARLRGRTPLEQYAVDAGFEPRVIYTNSAIHLRRMLREQVVGREERVAVAGGDGTLHAAVQVLAGTDTALGILPQGTANNFANALRLPLDLPSAFRVIAAGESRRVSLGDAGGEYFTEAAGVGVFADTLALSRSAGRGKSIPRTLNALFRLMVTNRPYHLSLIVDGERHEVDAFNVTVANSFAFGLNLPIAPHARLTDEHLDVVVIGSVSRREWARLWRAVKAQTHLHLPNVRCFQGRHIRLESRHSLRVHVDDRARRRTPVDLRVRPESLKVLVDRL
jgi:diacylglycerol kinase (ATP)